jgi:hypothetical protein
MQHHRTPFGTEHRFSDLLSRAKLMPVLLMANRYL